MTPTVLVNFLLEDDPRDFLNRNFAPEQIHHQLVTLAVEAAELVLPIFEQERPKDNRPRKAIEAVKAWLKNPSKAARKISKAAANAAAYAAADDIVGAVDSAAYAAVNAAYAAASDAASDYAAAYAANAASNASDAVVDTAPELIPALERIRSRITWLGSISKP